jgi:hypothetical protein
LLLAWFLSLLLGDLVGEGAAALGLQLGESQEVPGGAVGRAVLLAKVGGSQAQGRLVVLLGFQLGDEFVGLGESCPSGSG